MPEANPQIEIIEYDENYASLEDVKRFFLQNFETQMNAGNITGVYLSMRAKYGRVGTHLMMFLSIVALIIVPFAILTHTTEMSQANNIICSLLISIASNYIILTKILVSANFDCHMSYGHAIHNNFYDIQQKYIQNGGNFWLVVLSHPATGKKEIVGQMGFVNEKTYGHIEAVSIGVKYRGLGIGKKLVDTALSFGQAKKLKYVDLNVLAVNTTGVNLYKKYGFEITKTVEIVPLTGLSYHNMVKRLD
jgi:ribosomal protein S18 acetylase RimI-like enzyme